jgi:hypothetical protein
MSQRYLKAIATAQQVAAWPSLFASSSAAVALAALAAAAAAARCLACLHHLQDNNKLGVTTSNKYLRGMKGQIVCCNNHPTAFLLLP